jgi:hypothetical protein
VAQGGTSLVAPSGGPVWVPADPQGRVAQLAAALSQHPGVDRAVFWLLGEEDAEGGTTAAQFRDAFLALMDDVDTRVGHTNTHWVVAQLWTGFPAGDPTAVRSGYVQAQALRPTRITLLDTESPTLQRYDGIHYDPESCLILTDMFEAACADHFSDPDWEE